MTCFYPAAVSGQEKKTEVKRDMDVGALIPWLDHGGWRGLLRDGINGLLGVNEAYEVFEKATKREDTNVFLAVLEEMEMPIHHEGLIERLPDTGACIVVSNHPFGGADAIALTGVCIARRPDTRVLANAVTAGLPGASAWTIPLQIMGEDGATRSNRGAMKEALAHLNAGGVLVVFPSGAVSRWRSELGRVADPEWSDHVARLAVHAGVPVIPVRFFGKNPSWFEVLGVIHPMLRSALLIRVFLSSRGKALRFCAGAGIPAETLGNIRGKKDKTAMLRAAVEEIWEG